LSYAEKVLLVDLCVKYRDFIDNKRTDAVADRDKENGWQLLAAEFEAASGDAVKREWQQLKNVRSFYRSVIVIIRVTLVLELFV